MPEVVQSRASKHTRSALIEAFVELVLKHRYDRVKVTDVVARAGVARSTFYEYFRRKEDLLKAGLSGPMQSLADTLDCQDHRRVGDAVAHFWQNRGVASVLYAGSTGRLLTTTLAGLIEIRLLTLLGGRRPLISPTLLAAQLAGGQMALLTAWLTGKAPATTDAIADALHFSARGVLQQIGCSSGYCESCGS